MSNNHVSEEELSSDLLSPFNQVMDNHGLTLDDLCLSLKKELKAKKTDTFKATNKAFDDEGHLVSQTEEVIYSRGLVDWQTRQRARKDALAYRGIIAAEKMQLDHSGSLTVETGIRRPGDGEDE